MRELAYALAAVAAIGSATAASGQEKPVTDKNPSAVDVVATSAEDLNIHNKKIPAVLVDASLRPYAVPTAALRSAKP
jgi:hypothetical protein